MFFVGVVVVVVVVGFGRIVPFVVLELFGGAVFVVVVVPRTFGFVLDLIICVPAEVLGEVEGVKVVVVLVAVRLTDDGVVDCPRKPFTGPPFTDTAA